VSSPDPFGSPVPSALALGDVYMYMHAQVRRLVDEAMTAAGASMSRTKVLQLLARRGPLNQASIATEFGFAPRSITEVVDALERDHLAERLDDPSDRRSRLVRITDSGVVALDSAMHIKADLFEEIFAVLDPPSRTKLFSLLETVRNSLPAQPGELHVH
jgi:DNA-binding MarR family transcriptional regulator